MHLEVDVKCMHTNFGVCGLPSFRDYCYVQIMIKFPFPWSWKNLIDRNRLKKIKEVGIDVTYMHTNFGGRGPSGFGGKISLWSIKVENFNRSESAQKIHASRGRCHVHAHQFWWA